jgi:hypothetical protein
VPVASRCLTLPARLLAVALVCLVAGLAAAGAAHAQVSEPRPSLFSVNTNLYDTASDWTRWNEGFAKARSIGARWVEFTVGPGTATGKWGTLDYEVAQARKQHLGVLLNFGGIQSACRYTAGQLAQLHYNVTGCPPHTAGQLATYAAFMRKVVLRYKNSVDTYESWREENRHGSWRPAANPAEYAAFLKMQHGVFQTLNKTYGLHLALLFGGPNCYSEPDTNGDYPTLEFVHLVAAALHGAKAFDGVGLHAYRYPGSATDPAWANWGPTEAEWDFAPPGTVAWIGGKGWRRMTWAQDLDYTEQQLAADGYPDTPLWLTEFGWDGVSNPQAIYSQFAVLSAGWRSPNYGLNEYPSQATQATWLRQAYDTLLAMPFVKAAFWFNLRNEQPGMGLSDPDPPMFRYMGLFNFNYTPKPALAAWESLAKANPGR